MRILIHGINYSPELTGIGKYTGEMAEWLAAQGHEVRVVTAPPYYPQWKVADGFVNGWRKEIALSGFNPTGQEGMPQFSRDVPASGRPWLYAAEAPTPHAQFRATKAAVTIYRCPLWVPAKPSGLKRILHLASFALSSFPVMLSQIFWRPDVVWVVEPPLFCAPQACLVARLSGAKAWLHIQDYEVDAAFDLGLLKGKLLRGLVAAGERWLMRRFDRVSTISLRMVDRAVSKGVRPERVVMFRNWVEIKQEQEAQGGLGYRAELGITDDAFVALYSGNMGGKQGLEILADAARICRSGFNPTDSAAEVQQRRDESRPTEGASGFNPTASMVFVFCGNGAGRADLLAQCEGLDNVHFLDLQPVERLNELLAMADIHLLPQRADAADLVMPSKLTGMLASGRPVVATAHVGTELATVVESCGLVVPPEQAAAFAEAIQHLANDAALRAQLGGVGRAYAVAHLDREAVLASFEQALAVLAAKRPFKNKAAS